MALPNLSTLRCCPAPTSTILSAPPQSGSPDVCVICHAPLFGCVPAYPGSDADDWQNCNDPKKWRMRPKDEDGKSMDVAVMDSCGGMVHVGCLQGWIDTKRAESGAPSRTIFPCPKCAGRECISRELLGELEQFNSQDSEIDRLDAKWRNLGVRIIDLTEVFYDVLRLRTDAKALHDRIILERRRLLFVGFGYTSYCTDPATLLEGRYWDKFMKSRRPIIDVDLHNWERAREEAWDEEEIDHIERYVNNFLRDRQALPILDIPVIGEQRPPDELAMLTTLENFVNKYDAFRTYIWVTSNHTVETFNDYLRSLPELFERLQSLHMQQMKEQSEERFMFQEHNNCPILRHYETTGR